MIVFGMDTKIANISDCQKQELNGGRKKSIETNKEIQNKKQLWKILDGRL